MFPEKLYENSHFARTIIQMGNMGWTVNISQPKRNYEVGYWMTQRRGHQWLNTDIVQSVNLCYRYCVDKGICKKNTWL